MGLSGPGSEAGASHGAPCAQSLIHTGVHTRVHTCARTHQRETRRLQRWAHMAPPARQQTWGFISATNQISHSWGLTWFL